MGGEDRISGLKGRASVPWHLHGIQLINPWIYE